MSKWLSLALVVGLVVVFIASTAMHIMQAIG
jgi:hypothetical protein